MLINRLIHKSLPSEPVKLLLLICIPIMGVAIAKYGLIMGLAFIALPIVFFFLFSVISNPYIGLMTLFTYNYFVMGITRYFPQPLGFGTDLLFTLTYFSIFINTYLNKVDPSRANKDVTYLAFIWFLYGVAEFFNPLSPTTESWIYAIRGFNLYFFLTVPATLILFYRYRDLSRILNLWAIFSLLGALKGMGQYYIGLDRYETFWLNTIGNETHNLITGLRIFSFYTDAGSFGAAMGMSLTVFGILAIQNKKLAYKIFYGVVAVACGYGMLLSGTRGAIAVPISGLVLYMILSKKPVIIIIGSLGLIGTICFFKYTKIGEDIYVIRRMRTAFDPNESSLNTRLRNQAKLSDYLADKPFGGGIGTAGDWGQRFSPTTFLANTATDSWYVAIWAEQGIIGLILHLFILFYLLIKNSLIVMFRIKNKELSLRIKALLCGIFGIIVASYGNGVLGQYPTGIIFYMSLCFVTMAQDFDKELEEQTSNSKL